MMNGSKHVEYECVINEQKKLVTPELIGPSGDMFHIDAHRMEIYISTLAEQIFVTDKTDYEI